MTKSGDIIYAEIVRVCPFGVFLKNDSERFFVHMLEFEWLPTKSVTSKYITGDRIRIRVLERDTQGQQFFASIKRLNREANPYLQWAQSAPLVEMFNGVVSYILAGAIQVRLSNGLVGYCIQKGQQVCVKVGDVVRVRVEKIDADAGRLELEII